jgi:hypothetical protein
MIPTPTPFPTSVGTPSLVIGVDPAVFSRNLAMDGVQWYNIINANDIFTMIQVTIIIVIVFVGLKYIRKALNSDV